MSDTPYSQTRYKQELTIAILNGMTSREKFHLDDLVFDSTIIRNLNQVVDKIVVSQK